MPSTTGADADARPWGCLAGAVVGARRRRRPVVAGVGAYRCRYSVVIVVGARRFAAWWWLVSVPAGAAAWWSSVPLPAGPLPGGAWCRCPTVPLLGGHWCGSRPVRCLVMPGVGAYWCWTAVVAGVGARPAPPFGRRRSSLVPLRVSDRGCVTPLGDDPACAERARTTSGSQRLSAKRPASLGAHPAAQRRSLRRRREFGERVGMGHPHA